MHFKPKPPSIIAPTATEPIWINGQSIVMPKTFVTLKKWSGHSLKNTYGRKPLLDIDGKPMFAELAIRKILEDEGWEARWISPRKSRYVPLIGWKDDTFKNQDPIPFTNQTIINVLAEIAKLNNGSYSGCWDVVAIKGNEILFAESKRSKKDNIRNTQVDWLSAALKFGLQPSNFLVVQWSTSE